VSRAPLCSTSAAASAPFSTSCSWLGRPTPRASTRPPPISRRHRRRATRRGHGDRITYLHGDFVELAESIPRADIVTLDRVLNVYPDWERLARLSAVRAQRLYGLVYPRDTPMVRIVIFAMNLILRLRGKPVRAAIRPADEIERIARESGLSPHFSRNVGLAWQVAVYRRS
jgi:hypothetical protein